MNAFGKMVTAYFRTSSLHADTIQVNFHTALNTCEIIPYLLFSLNLAIPYNLLD